MAVRKRSTTNISSFSKAIVPNVKKVKRESVNPEEKKRIRLMKQITKRISMQARSAENDSSEEISLNSDERWAIIEARQKEVEEKKKKAMM